MSDKVYFQESKEYQMKVDVARCLEAGHPRPGASDEAIFAAAVLAIRQAVASLAGGGAWDVTAKDDPWRREGIRYDTADGRLKANKLTLGVEATDKRTKLKFKQHDFVPEMLFDKPKNATVLPNIKQSAKYKKHDTTLKREEDLHFDNIKYCASGSLYVKGRQTDVRDTGFFAPYYPGLARMFPKSVALQPVSRWNETIFDDITATWGDDVVDSWMLVNRWDAITGELLEAELSFKVAKDFDVAWNYDALRQAERLYLALQATGLFRPWPPIFTFANPVSSVDIVPLPAVPVPRKRGKA